MSAQVTPSLTSADDASDKTTRIKSIVAAFGCALFLTITSYAAKNIVELEGIEVSALRGIVTIVTIGPYIHLRYGLKSLKKVKTAKMALFFRCFGSLVGTVCVYTGVRYIDLPDFTSIQYTYLLLTTIAARIFLKEAFTWTKGAASVFAFLGVIMITKPSLFQPNSNDTAIPMNGKRLIGVSLAAVSALASATVICILRTLVSGKNVLHNTTIVFYSGLLSSCVLGVVSVAYRLFVYSLPNLTLSDAIFVLLTSSTAIIGQLLLAYSLQASNASFVAIIRSSAIVFSFGFQAIVDHQSLVDKPAVAYIGIAVIVISVCVVCIVDLSRKKVD